MKTRTTIIMAILAIFVLCFKTPVAKSGKSSAKGCPQHRHLYDR